MAKQTIGVGSAPNDNTGDFIRDAFIKVNANFDELYSDDAGDVDSVNGQTGTVVLDSDDIAEGSTNEYYTEAKVSANTSVAANTAKISNATHTGDVTGSTTLTIANDVVDHDNLDGRYTEVQDIATTSGTINLDASSYAAFNLTGNLTTATLNIQGIKTGQVIDILLSGTLSSAVLTLADDFTTSAINKVGSNDLDTTGTNLIQVLCVDDTDSDAILTWAVATYTTDTSA
jgi:hypothetical protein